MSKRLLYILFCAACLNFCALDKVNASHSMGVDLTYICLGGGQYVFTISFYRDCSGISAPNVANISLVSPSCNQNLTLSLPLISSQEISALCPTALSTCQGGSQPGAEQYIYTDTISLPPCPDWTFSWSHCCRNPLITNLINPAGQNIYIEATLDNSGPDCNSSPIFTTLPVPYICNGQPYSYNHGAIDLDGDSLVYTLVNPLTTNGVLIGYQAGYSINYPIFTQSGAVSFNTSTGQMNIVPNGIQVCVVTVLVEEYRNGVLIGTTMRDIQIIVLNCGNLQPQLNPPGIINLNNGTLLDTNAVEVCVGANLSYDVIASDPNNGDIITMTSNVSLALAGATLTTSGINPVTGTLNWTPSITDLGFNTYTVTIQDDGCPVLGTQTYSFEIHVINGTFAGADYYLCLGDTAQLDVTGGNQFLWTPSTDLSNDTIANPMAWPLTTTTYTVISDLTGTCGNQDDITVYVVTPFNLSTNADIILCNNGSAQLSANAGPPDNYTYQWTPSATLDYDTVQNPLASPTSTTTYEVAVTSSSGCTKTATQMVTVAPTPLVIAPTTDDKLLCHGSSTMAHANVDAGDCNAYIVNQSPYAPISGSGTSVSLGDDAMSPNLSIGFDFYFFCSYYDMFYISSNGFISFSSGSNGCCSGQVIPNAGMPNNLIAYAWEDLSPQLGTVEYFTTGASPNRILVVNFIDIPHYGGGNLITAQILLYESTNVIEIHTLNMPSDGGAHTMGIENSNGTMAFAVMGRNSSNWSASNECMKFTPLVPPPYTLTWLDSDSNIVGTTEDISITPDSSTTYTLIITDGACQSTQSVSVDVSRAYAGPDTSMCLGDTVQLMALYDGPAGLVVPNACAPSSGACNGIPVDYDIGAGTSVNSSTVYPAPYGNWYKNSKHQILYTAADLTTAGVTPGSITDIGFFVTSINGTTLYKSYEIKMGCTSASSLTTWITGLTTVYSPKNYNIGVGFNNHVLDIPYDWDGSSNIVIELCYDNRSDPSWTNNSSSPFTITGYTSVLYYRDDAILVCPYTSAQTSSSNRPNTRFKVCANTITPVFTWSPNFNISDTTISNPLVSPSVQTQYIVSVDNGSCILKDTIMVTPSFLQMGSSTINSSCSGICDGAITIIPTSGISPYTYVWNDVDTQITATATGLCAGEYSVTVTDNAGCFSVYKDTILDGAVITSAIMNISSASCNGICDGEATVASVGGTSPYTYLWSDLLAQTTPTATGLCADTLYVTITDMNGCTITDSVYISEPSVFNTVTNVSCQGACDGIAYVVPVGGFAPYTYLWSDPLAQTTAIATGLCMGVYISTVSDSNGCVVTDSVQVYAPYTVVSGTVCTDSTCNGSVTVTPVGGTEPYTYLWDDPGAQTDSNATGLCPGTYSIQVFDATNCIMYDTILIPYPLITSITDSAAASCANVCDGSAVVTPSGGQYPFTYLWDDVSAQTDSAATSLCMGNYNVQVIDGNGCVDTSSVAISGPTALVIQTSATCFGVCDGSATVIPSGGTSPYTYLWNDPMAQTDSIATGLCGGTYSVSVTDGNGCIITDTTTVFTPTSVMSIVDATCQGLCDGSVTASPVGGEPPFSYIWDDPSTQTIATANNLCVGWYHVSITDALGCVLVDSAEVSETSPLGLVQTGITYVSCYGLCDGEATLAPSEGTPPYTYIWDDPAAQTTLTVTNLCIGSYTMTLTDAAGCIANETIIITQPSLLLSAVDSAIHIRCNGDCNGEGTVSGSGGTAPYSYLWDDALLQTSATATGLCGDTAAGRLYYIVVTDKQGCSTKDSIRIISPSKLLATTDTTRIHCAYDCDGQIAIINQMGGWPPYSYLWNDPNSQTTSTATGLCSGIYMARILDSTGCELMMTDSVTALAVSPLIANFSAHPFITTIFNSTINFNNLSIGAIDYEWNFGDGSPEESEQNPEHPYSDIEPGVYDVWLVTSDAYGCQDSIMKEVIIRGDFVLFAPTAFTPNGDGINETFFPKGIGIDENNFDFYIFDRWGDMIFKSDDINEPWDGKANDGKKEAQIDTYVWLIRTYDINGLEHEYVGKVSIIQ
ncbi:MAG TPA: T9SS type B sorting domain-containing protein [Flavobacteriales bacterium]|nr:T9SS type B sorting domain-containing protein [Flavobacteriales bacterium]